MLKPKAKKGLVFRQEEEGAFLFDPDTGVIKVLNPVGAFIWKSLDGKKTSPQIAQQVARSFGNVKLEEAEKDLTNFLSELKKGKLLE
jgi:hypothetical protein